MEIKECGFFDKQQKICNLIPESFDSGLFYRFVECEKIAIQNCPYKKFTKGMISKEKLNDELKKFI